MLLLDETEVMQRYLTDNILSVKPEERSRYSD
jgi:hypothetical protein